MPGDPSQGRLLGAIADASMAQRQMVARVKQLADVQNTKKLISSMTLAIQVMNLPPLPTRAGLAPTFTVSLCECPLRPSALHVTAQLNDILQSKITYTVVKIGGRLSSKCHNRALCQIALHESHCAELAALNTWIKTEVS